MNSAISNLVRGPGLSVGDCLWLCLFGILCVISLQTPILKITEQNLAAHMVIEHTIFFFLVAASVKTAEIALHTLVSRAHRKTRFSQPVARVKSIERVERIHNNKNYDDNNSKGRIQTTSIIIRFWSSIIRKIFSFSSKNGFLWLSIPVTLLAVWHYPAVFDYAVLHEDVHVLQHISFIIAGATGFIALRTLGESFRIIILITLNAIMAFAGLLFAVTTDPVYAVYSINGHNEAGNYMLITCILLLLIRLPAYLIHRAFFYLRIRIKEQNIPDDKRLDL